MVSVATYASVAESVEKKQSRKTMNFAVTAGALFLVAVTCLTFAVYSASSEPAVLDVQELQARTDQLHYGDYIALKNVYNEYLLVSHSGRVYSGGYHQEFDHLQILSADNKDGVVYYGDNVVLVGQNDMFCSVIPSGQLTCRANEVTKDAVFTLGGEVGTGPVHLRDVVFLKSIYGYITGRHNGARGDTESLTSMERYKIERPGDESGVAYDEPLRYGMTALLRNSENLYLQTDPMNGWIKIAPTNGAWDRFDILSPMHRAGDVRYGDKVILRSHNDNLVMVQDNKLTAYSTGRELFTVFKLVGGVGKVHAESECALWSYEGFVNSEAVDRQASIDPQGHYYSGLNFQILFAFKH